MSPECGINEEKNYHSGKLSPKIASGLSGSSGGQGRGRQIRNIRNYQFQVPFCFNDWYVQHVYDADDI